MKKSVDSLVAILVVAAIVAALIALFIGFGRYAGATGPSLTNQKCPVPVVSSLSPCPTPVLTVTPVPTQTATQTPPASPTPTVQPTVDMSKAVDIIGTYTAPQGQEPEMFLAK